MIFCRSRKLLRLFSTKYSADFRRYTLLIILYPTRKSFNINFVRVISQYWCKVIQKFHLSEIIMKQHKKQLFSVQNYILVWLYCEYLRLFVIVVAWCFYDRYIQFLQPYSLCDSFVLHEPGSLKKYRENSLFKRNNHPSYSGSQIIFIIERH